MIITFFITMVATGATITETIITGIGLGAGLYCASRTKKTSYMPKKAR